MSNIRDIVGSIQTGNLSNEDLNLIIDAVKFARSRLSKQIKGSIVVGDRVSFHSSKRGLTMQGTVKKVAIKYVTVDTGAGLWRVPANMLTISE